MDYPRLAMFIKKELHIPYESLIEERHYLSIPEVQPTQN